MDSNTRNNVFRSDNFLDEESIIDEFLGRMKDKITHTVIKPKRLYFEIGSQDLLETVKYLFNELHCRLSTATAMETYSAFEILYHFSFDAAGYYICPKVIIADKASPQVNSISGIIKGAEWIEREMHELLGITFPGHPRLEPLLTGNHPKGIKLPLRYGNKTKGEEK